MTLSNKDKGKKAPLRQKKPVAESKKTEDGSVAETKKTKDDWTDEHQNALPFAYEKHKDTPHPKIWSAIRDDSEYPMFAGFDTRSIRMRHVPVQEKLKGVVQSSVNCCADKLTVGSGVSVVSVDKSETSGVKAIVSVDKSEASGAKAVPSSIDAPKSDGFFFLVGSRPETSSMDGAVASGKKPEQPLSLEEKITLKINEVLDLKKPEMVKYLDSGIENLKQELGLAVKNLLSGQNEC